MTAISDLLKFPATTVDSEHSTGNDIKIIQVEPGSSDFPMQHS